MIDPSAVIRERGVQALLEAAEGEYRRIAAADHQHMAALPFGKPMQAPDFLYNLGLLFAGLQLAPTMRVLDFGAGSCWLSRHLHEMRCATVSLDPSPTALELGKRLFADYPPVGGCVSEPVFLEFDGHTIQLEDEAVDRIICNASFHHVPNPAEVLREFARVLKPGGIAGFAEPGRQHSGAPDAQLEMRLHGVLENDVLLEDIWAWAQAAGFTDIKVKLALPPSTELGYEDYLAIANGRRKLVRQPRRTWSILKRHLERLEAVTQRTVFTLHKGPAPPPDSRMSFAALGGSPYLPNARDLSHEMRTDEVRYTARSGEPVRGRVRVRNTGTVRWLHTNLDEFAVVKLGGHLHDEAMNELDHDFLRARLERDVSPGDEVELAFSFIIERRGVYTVVLDMVSEKAAWFAQAGSEPVRLQVRVV